MICARVCIMYCILCVDLLYVLTVFYYIVCDYHLQCRRCNCLFVLCLECIVLCTRQLHLKYVYCEEVNVKMFEFPIHSSTPRGEVSGVAYIPYSQFRRCIRSSRTWIYLVVCPAALAEVLIWFTCVIAHV